MKVLPRCFVIWDYSGISSTPWAPSILLDLTGFQSRFPLCVLEALKPKRLHILVGGMTSMWRSMCWFLDLVVPRADSYLLRTFPAVLPYPSIRHSLIIMVFVDGLMVRNS